MIYEKKWKPCVKVKKSFTKQYQLEYVICKINSYMSIYPFQVSI